MAYQSHHDHEFEIDYNTMAAIPFSRQVLKAEIGARAGNLWGVKGSWVGGMDLKGLWGLWIRRP